MAVPKESFCKLLEEAIKDEEEAQGFYTKLQNAYWKDHSVETLIRELGLSYIEKIKQDEINHGAMLRKMKELFCIQEK